MNDPTELLLTDFLDSAAALERQLDTLLGNARGISFREYRLLSTLAANAAELSRVALADAVSLTPSAVTRALKPLEKLGLVTTVRNGRDARQSLARLTDSGSQLLADVQGPLSDLYRRIKLTGADRAVIAQTLAQFEMLGDKSWR